MSDANKIIYETQIIGDVATLEPRPLGSADIKPVVPTALMPWVFDPLDDKRSPATFALLDASRMPLLPERLQAADIPHKCLFTGGAAEDLADLAPWLVSLSTECQFTRDLFTSGDEPNPKWSEGRVPGLLFRSDASLDVLWGHLRKFTRIRDENGAWHALRYWEPRSAFHYLASGPLTDRLLEKAEVVIALHDNQARVTLKTADRSETSPKPLLNESAFRRELMLRWSAGQIADKLMVSMPRLMGCFAPRLTDIEDFSWYVLHWCQDRSMPTVQDGVRMSIIHAYLGLWFDTDPQIPSELHDTNLRQYLESADDPAETFAKALRADHAALLDLASRRVAVMQWIGDGSAIRFAEHQSQNETAFVVDAINRAVFGARYLENPLIRRCIFQADEAKDVGENLSIIHDELEQQRLELGAP